MKIEFKGTTIARTPIRMISDGCYLDVTGKPVGDSSGQSLYQMVMDSTKGLQRIDNLLELKASGNLQKKDIAFIYGAFLKYGKETGIEIRYEGHLKNISRQMQVTKAGEYWELPSQHPVFRAMEEAEKDRYERSDGLASKLWEEKPQYMGKDPCQGTYGGGHRKPILARGSTI